MPEPDRLTDQRTRARLAYERFVRDPSDRSSLNDAIGILERMLAEHEPGPEERAALLTSLGVMLTDRYQVMHAPGDLEEGIVRYREALELTSAESAQRATRLSNLGSGLWEYFVATRGSEVLREALDVTTQAVTLTPDDSAHLPQRILNLSAVAHEIIVIAPSDDLLDWAVELLHDVAEMDSPPGVASRLRSNLATFLAMRYERRRDLDDLRAAITSNRAALELGLPRLAQARTESNLGNCLWRLYLRDGATDDLEQAVAHHRRAVELTPDDEPALWDYLTNLGTSLAELGAEVDPRHLEASMDVLSRAWGLVDRFLGRAPIAHKLGAQDALAGLSARLVGALLQLDDAPAERWRALEIAERAKARTLMELLGWTDIPAPPVLDEGAAAAERDLVRRLREIDGAELSDHEVWPASASRQNHAAERARERERSLGELDVVWDRLSRSGPAGAAFTAMRRGSSVGAGELIEFLNARADDTALLSLTIGAEQTSMILLRRDREPVVVQWALGEAGWETIHRRFNREIPTGMGAERGESWLAPLLQPLGELRAALTGAGRVVIAPHRRGHVLPWNVAAHRARWTSTGGQPLPVVLVPSLSLLPRLRPVAAAAAQAPLIVGDPRGDLPGAEREARAVAGQLGVQEPLLGSDATVAAVKSALERADVAHIAAHASFSRDSPLDAAILLADGVLRARDILEIALDLDLLVLSACQTGVGAPLAGDELMGLTQAFLSGGARSLVVSLWPVSDAATGPLMEHFHAAARDGTDRATALAQAAAAVAAHPDWHHPYFWGAFALHGAWW